MTQPLRRRVHFIAGFDPRGVIHYHRLFRDEAAKQSKLNGSTIVTGPRKRLNSAVHRWDVAAQWPGGAANVDCRFQSWDDIVRVRWQPNRARCILRYLADFTRYVFCGAFMKLACCGKGPFYAAVVPLAICAVPLLLAAVIGLMGGWLAGAPAAALAVWTSHELSRRCKLVWLVNIYSLCCAWGRAPLPDLEQRLNAMAEDIAEAARADPCDETLVVGHSVGALLAISVMARLLEQGTQAKLVTLGGCVPFVGLMPTATHFRRDLAALAAAPELAWLDVASLSDGLSFARVDPLAV